MRPTSGHAQDHPVINAAVGHESSDVKLRPLLLALAGLVVLCGVALLAMREVWSGFLSRERQTQTTRPARFADETGQFPSPRNQPDPAGELRLLREHDAQHLREYGWVNRQAKLAHIPIDRAIDLVAERGLPARKSKREEMKRP